MTMIYKVGLNMFIETKAENLSGGNKRKLCLAMALLSRPKVLLIDEASAGVDPGSRRIMWNAIKDEGKDSAVVITTHAMEEAEAISDKIGIMVKGKLKCFGSLETIQNDYGHGYEIDINLDLDDLFHGINQMDEAQRYTSNTEVVKEYLGTVADMWRRIQRQAILDPQEEFSRAGLLCVFYNQTQKGEKVDL